MIEFTDYIHARPDGTGGIIISILDCPDGEQGNIEEVRLSAHKAASFAGQIITTLQEGGEEFLDGSAIAKELNITRQAITSRIRHSGLPDADITLARINTGGKEVAMRYWARRTLERASILRERGSGDVGLIGGIFWLLVLFYMFF